MQSAYDCNQCLHKHILTKRVGRKVMGMASEYGEVQGVDCSVDGYELDDVVVDGALAIEPTETFKLMPPRNYPRVVGYDPNMKLGCLVCVNARLKLEDGEELLLGTGITN